MTKYILKIHLILLSLFMIGLSNATIRAQQVSDSSATTLEWSTDKLDTGIYWKSYRGDDLFGSRQSINLIELYLDSVATKFKVSFLEDSMIKTSEFGINHDALVAINGSFFSRDMGGAVVFLKVDGKVVHGGNPTGNPYIENGAIGWTENNSIRILKKPKEGWQQATDANIMSSGPLLIHNSQIQSFNNDPFHQNRHPRTVIAITNDRRLFLVTIDGRSFQAYGMSIPELADFIKILGAVNALNLDGGGSTSMWIKNKTENGIVNYPSDNLEFDHEGEREVANAFLILSTKE